MYIIISCNTLLYTSSMNNTAFRILIWRFIHVAAINSHSKKHNTYKHSQNSGSENCTKISNCRLQIAHIKEDGKETSYQGGKALHLILLLQLIK